MRSQTSYFALPFSVSTGIKLNRKQPYFLSLSGGQRHWGRQTAALWVETRMRMLGTIGGEAIVNQPRWCQVGVRTRLSQVYANWTPSTAGGWLNFIFNILGLSSFLMLMNYILWPQPPGKVLASSDSKWTSTTRNMSIFLVLSPQDTSVHSDPKCSFLLLREKWQ